MAFARTYVVFPSALVQIQLWLPSGPIMHILSPQKSYLIRKAAKLRIERMFFYPAYSIFDKDRGNYYVYPPAPGLIFFKKIDYVCPYNIERDAPYFLIGFFIVTIKAYNTYIRSRFDNIIRHFAV